MSFIVDDLDPMLDKSGLPLPRYKQTEAVEEWLTKVAAPKSAAEVTAADREAWGTGPEAAAAEAAFDDLPGGVSYGAIPE